MLFRKFIFIWFTYKKRDTHQVTLEFGLYAKQHFDLKFSKDLHQSGNHPEIFFTLSSIEHPWKILYTVDLFQVLHCWSQ